MFHPGFELGTDEADELMRTNYYVHLIGILGTEKVGKTCFLTSLYMLLAHGYLPRHKFAGSQTLRGFEDRARGLRKWEAGVLPDKFVPRTQLQDPRNPAFMHLGLFESDGTGRRVEILLTDLPGEWSETLIDRADTANRFEFLARADGIILMIDGPLLSGKQTRHIEIQKTHVLLERLRHSIKVDPSTPLVLLLTKGDMISMQTPPGLKKIEDYAIDLGFSPVTIQSIAFSRNPTKFQSGMGIIEAIEAITKREWPIIPVGPKETFTGDTRSFAAFRRLNLTDM